MKELLSFRKLTLLLMMMFLLSSNLNVLNAQNNKFGAWLWYIDIVTKYTTHEKLAAHLTELGVKRVFVKVGDGTYDPNTWPEIVNKPVVDAYKNAGLEVWGWSYNYPSATNSQEYYEDQAKCLYEAAKLGYTGYILDLEIEFDGKKTALHDLMEAFTFARDSAIADGYATEDFPIYATTWGNPKDHNFHVEILDQYVDGHMPQTYIEVWKDMSNPAASVNQSIQDYRDLGCEKPVHCIVSSEGKNTPITSEKIDEFFKAAGPEASLWAIPHSYMASTSDKLWETFDGVNWNMTFGPEFVENVPYFYQFNNTNYPGKTCAITSMAMVLKYYGAEDITPDLIYEHNGNDYTQAQSVEGWEAVFNKEAIRYGLTVRDNSTLTGTIEEVQELLAQGIPVVVHGYFTEAGHVVTLVGYNGTHYYVNDPAGKWNQKFKGGGYSGINETEGKYIKYNAEALEAAIAPDGNVWMHKIYGQPDSNVPIEDFESTTETLLPESWGRFVEIGTINNDQAWISTDETPLSGSRALKMANYMSVSDCWLVTPQFSPGKGNGYHLTFYTRSTTNDYGSKLEIFVSEHDNQPVASTEFQTEPLIIINEEEHNQYVKKAIDLTAYAGKNIYVGFKIRNFGDPLDAMAGGDNWWIDDVAGLYGLFVNQAPQLDDKVFAISESQEAGAIVGQLKATDPDIDFQNLTYSITDGNFENAFAIDSQTGKITIATTDVLDAVANPFYKLTVKVEDDAINKLTDEAIITINITSMRNVEGFEYTTDEELPYGWIRFAENGDVSDNTAWVSTSEVPFEGTRVIKMFQYASKSDCWAVSPGFVPDENTALRFYSRTTSGNYNSYLKVFIYVGDTQPTSSSDFTAEIAIFGEGESGDYLERAIDLSAYVGQNVFIGFVVENFGDGDNWWIDNISFYGEELANQAPIIENQTFTIEENSESGTIIGTVEATDKFMPPQDLTFSITEGNDEGNFAIDAQTGEITVVNADILDYETYTKFTITVEVKDNGEGELSSTATITIKVKDGIDAGIASNDQFGDLVFYPNPVSDVLKVEMKGLKGNENVIVYNIEGAKIIETKYSNITDTGIDVSSFTEGIYIVRIKTDKVIATGRFIKIMK